METILAVALYVVRRAARHLRHRPWLLIFIILVQATVYICGPIASVWNLWAQGVPAPEYRRRFDERRLRAERRRRPWARLPRPAAAAALTALCAGGVASAFLAPVRAAAHDRRDAHQRVSPQSLLALGGHPGLPEAGLGDLRGRPRVLLHHLGAPVDRVGAAASSSASARPRSCCSARSCGRPRTAGRSRTSAWPSARRAWTASRRPSSCDTFGSASVTSFKEQLSGTPTGTVSLALPAVSDVVSTPGALQRVGPFAGLLRPALATKVYVTTGTGTPAYAVTAVQLSQAAPGAALDLGFTTSSLPLLDGIFRDQGDAVTIPACSRSPSAPGTAASFATALTYTFSGLSVGSFAENLSGSLSGTAATRAAPPRGVSRAAEVQFYDLYILFFRPADPPDPAGAESGAESAHRSGGPGRGSPRSSWAVGGRRDLGGRLRADPCAVGRPLAGLEMAAFRW